MRRQLQAKMPGEETTLRTYPLKIGLRYPHNPSPEKKTLSYLVLLLLHPGHSSEEVRSVVPPWNCFSLLLDWPPVGLPCMVSCKQHRACGDR